MGVTGMWCSDEKEVQIAERGGKSTVNGWLQRVTAVFKIYVASLHIFSMLCNIQIGCQLTEKCLSFMSIHLLFKSIINVLKWREKYFCPDETSSSDVGTQSATMGPLSPPGLSDVTQAERRRWCLVVTGLPALCCDATTAREQIYVSALYIERLITPLISSSLVIDTNFFSFFLCSAVWNNHNCLFFGLTDQ